MAAITQIRRRHSQGRAYYDKKLAEGKTPKEALRSLKRQVSNAIFACLQADARRAAAVPGAREGSRGTTLQPARPARTPGTGSSDKPLPGPVTTLRPRPAAHRLVPPAAGAELAIPRVAATLPPATPKVQVERPQRTEDERPGGAARRRPYTGREEGQGPLIKPQRPKGISPCRKADGTP